ncbi:MAG: hypothetical protein FJX34_03205 [Alphaproteobacteria bacterium]|nr:hypothetical protein [Alphaproteobacteria bacterium]
MYYIILSNIGLAVMVILLYLRYSHVRVSLTSEIKTLRRKFDEQSDSLRVADDRLVQGTMLDSQKIQSLLTEIDELRKEKENEVKLRLNAEKQVEMTLQKVQDLEHRMEDWTRMQDAVMQDSKDAIIKVGNELYRKLNDSYKQEVDTTRNLVGRVSKSVTDFFDNFKATLANPPKPQEVETTPKPEAAYELNLNIHVDDLAKKLVPELVETMKASGHLANKDYFLPANFDEQKAKLLLCEVAFVGNEVLNIIDFKACNYLAEFEQLCTQDKFAAENHLKQKLDKYFAYLSNPKYHESILKAMTATRVKFEKIITIVVVPTKQKLQLLKEIRYYEKARRYGFEVMDMDGVNNIVL